MPVLQDTYDAQGNLTTRTDPRGKATTFDYNAINKSVSETDPTGKFIRYDYDENGNLKLIEKGKGTNVASTQEFTYDRKNRVSEKWVGGAKVYTNTYDRADNKTSITLPDASTYLFTYDDNKRVLSATEPGGYKIENTYDTGDDDNNGLRTQYKETIGAVVESTSFVYDALKRMTSITGPLGGVVKLFYDEKANRSRIQAGATTIYQDFDETGKLTGQSALFGSSLLSLKYTYFPSGELSTYAESGTNNSYTYDFAGDFPPGRKTAQRLRIPTTKQEIS